MMLASTAPLFPTQPASQPASQPAQGEVGGGRVGVDQIWMDLVQVWSRWVRYGQLQGSSFTLVLPFIPSYPSSPIPMDSLPIHTVGSAHLMSSGQLVFFIGRHMKGYV
ncbi:hypothetical protein Pcinc_009894, partial [Petrolisthes cinctipes]